MPDMRQPVLFLLVPFYIYTAAAIFVNQSLLTNIKRKT